MLGLDANLLGDLSKRLLSVVVAEAAGEARDDDTVRREVDARLRRDPNLVFELFEQYFVDSGDAQERRDEEVASVTDDTIDFRRALSYLHDPELGSSASSWLRGSDPGEPALRKLGISGPIATPEDARRGLQLLSTLCGRAGTALIIYLDQYEKLVVGNEGYVAGNAGLLSGSSRPFREPTR